jgi:SSS family solute:Na+ symporter
MACCLAFTAWAILSEPSRRTLDFGINFPFNPILIGFFSHVVLFGTGWLASRVLGGHRPDNIEDLVYWSTRRRPTVS